MTADVRSTLIRVALALAVLATSAVVRAQPVAYAASRARSSIHIVTGRAGAFAFLGHDHAVLATEWSARICYDPDDVEASSIRVVVPTRGLAIDSPEALAAAGTTSRPNTGTVEDLQRRMLSPEFLDAASHPELRFESRTAAREGNGLVVTGDLTLHGTTRTLTVPVRVSREPGGTMRFRVETRLRMTAFGIEPESTLGLIDVADPFLLVVDLVARPGSGACGDGAPGPARRRGNNVR